jgi:GxxExxY protein
VAVDARTLSTKSDDGNGGEVASVLELKAVERTQPLHEAQLLTYLRLSPCRVGLLINFNTVSLTDGIKRCIL